MQQTCDTVCVADTPVQVCTAQRSLPSTRLAGVVLWHIPPS